MKISKLVCYEADRGFLIPKDIPVLKHLGFFLWKIRSKSVDQTLLHIKSKSEWSYESQPQHTEAVNELGIGCGVVDWVDAHNNQRWRFTTALDEVGVKRDSTPHNQPETQCAAVEMALTCAPEKARTGFSDDQRVGELSRGSGKGQNQQAGFCAVGDMGHTDNGYRSGCSKHANLFFMNKGACFGRISEAVFRLDIPFFQPTFTS